MENKKEFNPGIPPQDPHEEIVGLRDAIEATKRRIMKYKANKWDFSEFEFHLKNLEQRLEAAQKKIR